MRFYSLVVFSFDVYENVSCSTLQRMAFLYTGQRLDIVVKLHFRFGFKLYLDHGQRTERIIYSDLLDR